MFQIKTTIDSRFVALCFILLLSIGVRAYHSDLYTYGCDQSMHIQISDAHSTKEVWQFSKNETHPPLGYIIRYFWLKISHQSGWIHALGYCCDLITILLLYLIGNRLEPGSGLFAALLGALCPMMVNMAQITRNYSIFLMFMTACLYSYLRFIEKREGKWLLLYTLMAGLAVASHLGTIIPLTGMGSAALYIFFREKNWRQITWWLAANGMVALVLLWCYFGIKWVTLFYGMPPKVPFIEHANDLSAYFIPMFADYLPMFLPNFIDQMPDFLKDHTISQMIVIHGTKILLVVLMCPIIIRSYKTHKLFFYVALISIVAFYLLCVFQYYDIVPRHNLWLAPFIIVLCAMQLYRLKPFYPIIFVWLAISTILIPFHDDDYRKNDETMTVTEADEWRQYIHDHVQKGDVIVGGRSPIIIFYQQILGRNYYRDLPPLEDKSYYISHHLDVKETLMRATDGGGRSYISPAYEYTFMTEGDVDLFFNDVIAKGWLNDAHHVWFLSMIDANEKLADNLATCPKLQNEITDKFMRSGDRIRFFALPKDDLLEILKPDGKFHSCLQMPK